MDELEELTVPNSAIIPSRSVPSVNCNIIKAIRKRKFLCDTFKRRLTWKGTKLRNRVVTMLHECKEFFHKLDTANAKDF